LQVARAHGAAAVNRRMNHMGQGSLAVIAVVIGVVVLVLRSAFSPRYAREEGQAAPGKRYTL